MPIGGLPCCEIKKCCLNEIQHLRNQEYIKKPFRRGIHRCVDAPVEIADGENQGEYDDQPYCPKARSRFELLPAWRRWGTRRLYQGIHRFSLQSHLGLSNNQSRLAAMPLWMHSLAPKVP